MGALGRRLPKAVIPIAPGMTPLSRLLQQIREVPHQHLVISTAPRWAGQLSGFLDRHRASAADGGDVRVEVNPDHRRGPVAAFQWIAARYPADDYLLLLGDVIFLANPFAARPLGVERSSLVTAQLEPGRGGVVQHRDGHVKRLFYAAGDCPWSAGHGYSNWSGAACLPRRALLAHPGEATIVLEAMVNGWLDAGIALRCSDGPQFINLNQAADLARCRSLGLT